MIAPRRLSKAKVITVIRRAGYPPEVVDRIASQLPDPVDLDREASLLARYGISHDQLIDRFGGSP
jgi:hypothetical protein